MVQEIFSTAGTGSWICPSGVTTVYIQLFGSGGKGGTRTTKGAGGGGGAGAFVSSSLSVIPGNVYSYVVGQGASAQVSGSETYFSASNICMAKGGASVKNNFLTGAPGGNSNDCIGDIRFSGGNGADGVAGSFGGGGGEGASNIGVGNNAVNATGGTGNANGGDGGNGRSTTQGNGIVGSAPGGGGGGGLRTSSGTRTGGNGGTGMIILEYTIINTVNTTYLMIWDHSEN